MAAMCSQQAGSFIDLPVQRIEQVVQPTAQQHSAFDDLTPGLRSLTRLRQQTANNPESFQRFRPPILLSTDARFAPREFPPTAPFVLRSRQSPHFGIRTREQKFALC
jgi:hypothetical protein